jgi:hypothetical protein
MLSVGQNLASGKRMLPPFKSRKIEKGQRRAVREQREHSREKRCKRAEKMRRALAETSNGNDYEEGQKQNTLELWLNLFYYLVCSGNYGVWKFEI